MIAYHIDRKNILSENQTIQLIQEFNIDSEINLNKVIQCNYPDGLSSHGIKYYASAQGSSDLRNLYDPLRENILEYERKCLFPHLISRYQSFFAIDNEEDLHKWLKVLCPNNQLYSIFKINYAEENSLKRDATWLNKITPHSFLTSHYYAHKYWTGEVSDSPLMELLIKPPIKINEKVFL